MCTCACACAVHACIYNIYIVRVRVLVLMATCTCKLFRRRDCVVHAGIIYLSCDLYCRRPQGSVEPLLCLKFYIKLFSLLARRGVAYENSSVHFSFRGTKVKSEMTVKFAALLKSCSSVQVLKYVSNTCMCTY